MIEMIKKKLIDRLEKAAYNHADYGTDMGIDENTVIAIVEDIFDEYNNGWIPVSERLPNEKECRKDNGNFIVQSDMGERFSCEFDSLANGYDNPRWACNVVIVAWQPLPEPWKEREE